MVKFQATLERFISKGEKSGWTYFLIPKKLANKLHPGYKKSFRVKGSLDQYKITGVALLPMGEGEFIMPVNAIMRKAIHKGRGDTLDVDLEVDDSKVKISTALLTCLKDDPEAKKYFEKLPPSHQQYYSKWIESAKTEATKITRIALAITAFSQKMSFSQLIQMQKKSG